MARKAGRARNAGKEVKSEQKGTRKQAIGYRQEAMRIRIAE